MTIVDGHCDTCGEECPSNRSGSLREVIGYEEVRAQGGANAIRSRKPTGRVLCPTCAADLKYGGNANQGQLI